MKNEDHEILITTELRAEIAREVEVFSTKNDEIERMTSDGEDSDVEPPPTKRQKQNAKKFQDKCEMVEAVYASINIFKF